ncbi:hypothetical protein BKA82DRAFT_26184 [Pisolithus tinctorius]|uniref:Uncharacterized protein n=1 Tax=Pisolithus tinctorius Marx 270 TaxID=870435 RepID=A0A0C3K469_PISTI|nr:hypothetical protein BKA82DRAFT_26184 [Pisolithus tinctorius]KIO04337.1 hypothetical protein M404DRAFT_26184 [Pisolithus tinctorius Marx 270]
MSQQAETSQTAAAASPITLPHEIVANAADIVMVELLTLHDHRNRQYWQKAMHVIWEQLTCVCPLVEELPSKFTIPTHIITTEMVMRDLVVLTAVKEWPDFDKIRDATDADVVDHLWYQIGQPVDKGKGHTVPLEPLQISDTAATAAETLEEPHGRSTSHTAPTGTWPRSRRLLKRTRSRHMRPVTPNATPMEHMEEEIAALWQQHMEMAQDLLDTFCKLADTQWALADTQTKLQTLADVVEALQQRLYPLPHSSPNAPGPSHPSAVSFAITSHQAVIPTDGARILDLAPTTMVQEVAINTGILQSLPGDMLLAPSTFLLPTHHFPYSSTAGVGEAPPPIYVSLGAVANDAGGDDSDDQNAANWMDVD